MAYETVVPPAQDSSTPDRHRPIAAADRPRQRIGEAAGRLKKDSHRLFKRRLIDYAAENLGARSFADLGGVWAVDGEFSFYSCSQGFESGTLVDTHVSAECAERAAREPRLRIVQGNFGHPDVAASVGPVDVVLLFDVLLHQAAPDWRTILALYAEHADCYVIVNPQWTGPGHLVRLIDLGEKEYFRNVPHHPDEGIYQGLFDRLDQPHPDHDGLAWRDVHHIWQWGISDASLIGSMHDLGYRLVAFANNGSFCGLPRFESHGFVFVRS